MTEVEIRQRAALKGQRGGRRGQEGWPAPPYRANWRLLLYILYERSVNALSVSWRNSIH